eukprot:TRINITY_DN68052_c3_g12_i1.p1 TRINITY_DN68052_c3_g12~~TRINITY_DN68052_c3_g12_i1.p1  ORF type:complete len:213 (+),score=30.27 TRINITY_DN68052_c3_g12_i1:63-641(+)
MGGKGKNAGGTGRGRGRGGGGSTSSTKKHAGDAGGEKQDGEQQPTRRRTQRQQQNDEDDVAYPERKADKELLKAILNTGAKAPAGSGDFKGKVDKLKRKTLNRTSVRKVMQVKLGHHCAPVSVTSTLVVSGVAHAFMQEVIAVAHAVQRDWDMVEYGQIRPAHVAEAFRRLSQNGWVPAPALQMPQNRCIPN